jgi:hypothetical protein
MNDVSAPGAETPEQRAIEIRGPVCCPPPDVLCLRLQRGCGVRG